MDTSGSSTASIVVALVVLGAFISAAPRMVREGGRPIRVPVLAIVLVVVRPGAAPARSGCQDFVM